MLRTAVDGLKSGDINAVSLYTHDGIELVKGKAEISTGIIDRLKRLNVSFVYKKDNNINISMVYDRNIIAGLHKVLSCFIESNGNNAEILKRYNNEEVKEFLRVNNEFGTGIAYGHIMRFYAEKMAEMLGGRKNVIYDFVDYRRKDNYLIFHMINTCCMCMAAASNMGLDKETIVDAGIGTMLYDFKMKTMPFFYKNSALNKEESEKVKEHTVLGYEYLRSVYGIPSRSSAIAVQHHERHDGSGYPKNLSGNEILLLSRIAAVCDVYDSMTSERQHRAACNPEDAWDYIRTNSGVIFDPEAAAAFLKTVPKFMPGDIVELACGKHAVVSENYPERPENPDIILIEKTGENDIIGLKIGKKSEKVAAEGGFQTVRTTGKIR